MAHFLICYDIANAKRLGRVHRAAAKYATLVQYSVYYFEGSPSGLKEVLAVLQAELDDSEDDVRAYAVAPLKEGTQMGRSWLPEGVLMP